MYEIAIIEGDGIGKEVIAAGKYLLEELDIDFNFKYAEAGYDCFLKNGTVLPEETIKIAKESDAILFGAVTSTPGQPSTILNLRQALNVYANLRPVKSFAGVESIKPDIDFLIVRENTEGLYSETEYEKKGKFIAERHITKEACERIARVAFEECKKKNKSKVTCVHKANIMKLTDNVFKDSFYKVASEYPEIETEDYYVDAAAMYLITKPETFDVIVTTNLFGDILSDEGTGLVGGLGLAPSGNIGEEYGLFEPVHGSAPDIAGQNIANPCSMILTVAMMLDYLNESETADKIKIAVENVLKKGKIVTPDLGGSASTMEMAEAIVDELKGGI